MPNSQKVSVDKLSEHNTSKSAWVVINNAVWDVTSFSPNHPGGEEVIAEYYGQDATKAYNEVHGPGLVAKHLDKSCYKGELDLDTVTQEWKDEQVSNIQELPAAPASASVLDKEMYNQNQRPPLDAILNMYDFEDAAKKQLSLKSFAFYSAAANDCLSLDDSIDFYRKVWFRPRVLRGVKNVNTQVSVLGNKFDVPFFSAPAALAKLSHPDGEQAMARALVSRGTTICACNNASFSLSEIMEAMPKGYPCFYQLYVNKDRSATEKLMKEVDALGPKAILVTVDLPVVGKREADERVRIETTYKTANHASVQKLKGDKKGSGLARASGSFIDSDLKWEDIKWLKSLTNIPVFLKGIQSAADAKKAYEHGCAGIYLSNHGGRAVDTAQPSLLTLLEIQANCPEILAHMEVFIDGGIRRGTDVLKAICLGASAVCLGRPFLYAVTYGQEGMEHAIDLLRDELETAMQMIGITSLSEAHPGLLNTSRVDQYVYRGDAHPWAHRVVRQNKL